MSWWCILTASTAVVVDIFCLYHRTVDLGVENPSMCTISVMSRLSGLGKPNRKAWCESVEGCGLGHLMVPMCESSC
ncbi:hypothetical protein V6N13_130749 [Hibiscus sabdariffa]|uniref:Secreted protein n=1 Tax=Hibiscus sabdariffa TaxID=183260 RepID=A0ABR2BR62_9ROSI